MEFKICQNKEEWDRYQKKLNLSEFLQSWEWGEFQRATGKEVLRLQIWEDDVVVEQIQGFVHKIGWWKYLYLPRLQLANGKYQSVLKELQKLGFIFVRIEPLGKELNIGCPVFTVKNRQPQNTLILNLNKSEEKLLEEMHSKTRYNINLAERKEVIVTQEKNIDIFWDLNLETTGRDKFKSHDKDYYAKMLEMPTVYQLVAYYKQKPIASNIMVGFGDTFTYLHGASSSEFRNLMAPYLLQWEGIKLGKNLGFANYDFWGIAPLVFEDDKKQYSCFHGLCWEINHPWTGVTRFKAGFGGEARQYPQAFEVSLNWKYNIFNLIKNLKNKKH